MDDYYGKNLLNNYTSFENDDELKRENTNDAYGQGCSSDLWKNPVSWESPNYGPGQEVNFGGRQGSGSSQRYSMKNASPSSLSLRDVALLPTPPKFEDSKFSVDSPNVGKVEDVSGAAAQDSIKSERDVEEERCLYPSFRFMRSRIRLGIRAANHPRVFLTPCQLQALGNHILERILGPEGQRVRPRFYGMCMRNGVLAMCCGDPATSAWVRELGTKSFQGIPLEVVEEPSDGKIYIAVGHFPRAENDPDERILRFLEIQNVGLDCSRWRIMNKAFEKKGAVRITFSLDFSSAQTLKSKGPLLNFKFGAARFMVKTKRGINFKEEEYEEEDEMDCLVVDSFPPEEGDEDGPKGFPYGLANADRFGGFQFGTTSRNPYACPSALEGEYGARVARVVEKSKNSLRFGLTSRERYLNKSKLHRSRKKNKKKKGKTEPT